MTSSGSLLITIINYDNANIRTLNAAPDNWHRRFKINLDASKTVPTGDRVMPRTMFENLYVIISE